MTPSPLHLDGLNPAQLEAVTSVQGPLLILAGAGSGKTRVLTRRVAHLIHLGVPPWQILAVTFTNKAAAEMRQRVQSLVGPAANDILVSTFHSACVRFLRRDAPALGYPSSFSIYDDDDQVRVLKAVLESLKIDVKRWPPKRYGAIIDRAKNRLETAATFNPPKDDQIPRAADVFARYTDTLKRDRAFDFNDLINEMVRLLEEHPDILARYQDRFRYILVDEFQDTNPAQYRLVRLLAERYQNLAVVGDDDQSIYSFRGADIRNILGFEKDFPDARVVKLEQNYRSSASILSAASRLVANNTERKEKTLWTQASAGAPVEAIVGVDEEDEAEQVVARIEALRREGYKTGDFAIIYRTNAASRPVEKALSRSGLPYVVVGGKRFYERKEVRDLLAYLRVLQSPADNMALRRILNVPSRGIGDVALQALESRSEADGVPLLEAARRVAAEGGARARPLKSFTALMDSFVEALRTRPLGDVIHLIAEDTGYLSMLRAESSVESQGRMENIAALEAEARKVCSTLQDDTQDPLRVFLDQAALTAQSDELPDDQGRVTLLTAHLAKGLEFPVVFVVGLVEGVFPHAWSSEDQRNVEEERRLAYVSFTRARERLFLCRPRMRRAWSGDGGGWQEHAAMSRFLDEIRDPIRRPTRTYRAPDLSAPTPSPKPVAARDKLSALLGPRSPRAPEPPPRAPRPAPPVEPEPEPPRLRRPPVEARRGRTLEPDGPDLFQPGTRVTHPVHGAGHIVHRDGSDANPRLLIRFDKGGTKVLMAAGARLTILLE